MLLWAERGHCHLGYSPVVPRQSQSYAGLCTFMIACVPLGSTLGDNDPFGITITSIFFKLIGLNFNKRCHADVLSPY